MLFQLSLGIPVLLLCLFVTAISLKSEQATTKPSPLVIIHGLSGTQMYGQFPTKGSKPFLLWVSPYYVINLKKFTMYSKLTYDPQTHRTRDSPLVNISFPGWGDTWSIKNLAHPATPLTDYFGSFVRSLVKKNPFYVRNKTVRSAPYDFRRAPNEAGPYFNKLKLLIEETYQISGGRRVMLLSHSMGGLYSIYFLKIMSSQWKKKFIRGYISASTPLAGSLAAIEAIVHGTNFNIPLVKPLRFREYERTAPCTTFLLPKIKFWSKAEPLIITPNRNYTVFDYQKLFNDIKASKSVFEMYKDTRELVDPERDLPQVDELYCICGQGVKTKKQLIYTKSADFPDHLPNKLEYEDGDGTVSSRSLLMCRNWKGVVLKRFPGVRHVKTFQDEATNEYVINILIKGE